MINFPRMQKTFLEYVAIPSPSRAEAAFAAHIKKELAQLGIKCREDNAGKKIEGDCGNLLAKVPGDKALPTVMLCGHLDTVETGEQAVAPKIKSGYIVSGGATILGADNKAAVAAIVECLRTLKEKQLRHPPLEIVFTVSEETGLTGAKEFDCQQLKAQAGFILDASGEVGQVINRAPAYDAINAVICGRAAHAGACPEAGVSAIQIAGHAIAAMKLGRIDDKTTANIGLISGGTGRNVVPEMCRLSGEARSHSEARLKRQVQHMLRCIHRAAAKFEGSIEIEIEREFDAFFAPQSSRPVRIAKKAAKKLGVPFGAGASGGGADTAVFAAAGLPCITLGIGVEHPHSINERISLEQLRLLGEYTIGLVCQ